MTARVVVVGLGPAGPDLVTSGTLEVIERVGTRFIRTARHPAAVVVPDAHSFDHLYEAAASMDDVYQGILEALVETALAVGEVLYAVPGSPVVAERTVELLLADERVVVDLVPALSFLDLAWVRLGVDPVEVGARLVDGHRFAVEAAGERGPLLVAQCDRPSVLSDIKLSVDEPPDAPVVVVRRLGLPDESITSIAWEDLDRDVEPDHLTSLWIPRMHAPVAGKLAAFVALVARLRDECPWDREQTHRTLAPFLVEESYEVVDVLDRMPPEAGSIEGTGLGDEALDDLYDELEGELGDLLFQIVIHARLASESGRFTLADVARGIHDKLVSRHPHVFGEVDVDGDARAVEANWERIKADETGRTSAFDGIPHSLPALARAAKVLTRAGRIGLVDEVEGGSPAEVLSPGEDASPDEAGLDEGVLGDRLLALVELCVANGVDPEAALRASSQQREHQLRTVEREGR